MTGPACVDRMRAGPGQNPSQLRSARNSSAYVTVSIGLAWFRYVLTLIELIMDRIEQR